MLFCPDAHSKYMGTWEMGGGNTALAFVFVFGDFFDAAGMAQLPPEVAAAMRNAGAAGGGAGMSSDQVRQMQQQQQKQQQMEEQKKQMLVQILTPEARERREYSKLLMCRFMTCNLLLTLLPTRPPTHPTPPPACNTHRTRLVLKSPPSNWSSPKRPWGWR